MKNLFLLSLAVLNLSACIASGCPYSDGKRKATVVYYNPKTNHTATYTLDVDVVNCQVVKLYFSNGGWLDESHITFGDIDQYGEALVKGEEGKTYNIKLK